MFGFGKSDTKLDSFRKEDMANFFVKLQYAGLLKYAKAKTKKSNELPKVVSQYSELTPKFKRIVKHSSYYCNGKYSPLAKKLAHDL